MSKLTCEEFVQKTGIGKIHSILSKKHKNVSQNYIMELQRKTLNLESDIFKFFDEAFYIFNNRDVADKVFAQEDIDSGLHHFLRWGIFEGRLPMRASDLVIISNVLINSNNSVESTYQCLSFDELCDMLNFIEPEALAKCYIREQIKLEPKAPRLGIITLATHSDRPWLGKVYNEFDESYYSTISGIRFKSKSAAFRHYLGANFSSTANPNEYFDEAFYRTFHYDIGQAIERGELLCGFEHYIVAGRDEQRLPRFDSVATLEAVIPGVTAPIALTAVNDIENKIVPCPHRVDPALPPTIWIILPFLYTDIMFGGFASFIEFIEELIQRSLRIGLFIKDAPSASLDYFKYRSPKRLLTKHLTEITVYSPIDSPNEFVFSPKDIFICYSNWDGLWGLRFAERTELGKPVFWIQEHEAIFHSFDSRRFLLDSVYQYKHIGIFNSEFLRAYFHRQKIGHYKSVAFLESHSVSYEHVLQYNRPNLNTKPDKKRKRRLLLYTRPECHAARNLFEIAIVGLRLALAEGIFDDGWEFKGIGSLGGPYVVDLVPGITLEIVPKMPLDSYREFIQGVDIGVSLMYAPHPSLLPYEIALTGAIVVTNNFEERGPEFFNRFEGNIESFDPSVDQYVDAIRRSVQRVTAAEFKKHLPDHHVNSWNDVFSDKFFDSLQRVGLDFTEHIKF